MSLGNEQQTAGEEAQWEDWVSTALSQESEAETGEEKAKEADKAEPDGKPSESEAAAQLRAEMDRRMAELQSQIQGQQERRDGQTETAIDPQSLEALKSDFPELFAVFEAQAKTLEETRKQVETLNQREQQRIAEEERRIVSEVQAEIDKNPYLAHWQKHDPDVFAEAAKLDELMKANPKLAQLPMGDRFAKVAEAMAAIHGVPKAAGKKPPREPAQTRQPARTPMLGDLPQGEEAEAETTLEGTSAWQLISAMADKPMSEVDKAFERL